MDTAIGYVWKRASAREIAAYVWLPEPANLSGCGKWEVAAAAITLAGLTIIASARLDSANAVAKTALANIARGT
jgi:hypothetical protein